jgi:uncharacterized protein (TIGR00251 family)
MFLRVKIIPRSATSEIAEELGDGTLKIKIAAPPEHGRANAALVALLSQRFHVARSAVTIVSGHAASRKLIRVDI